MSRILVCGEGPNDIGRRDWVKRRGDHATTDGWLQPLVARLRSSEGDVYAIQLKTLFTAPGRGGRALDGLARKAHAAKFRAKSEGCTGVVLATDVDSNDPRDHARKHDAILEGFAAIDNGVVGVACVPMATSEAWLMADWAAWQAQGAGDDTAWPNRPETLWGRPHEPGSNHPKNVFARICADNAIVDDTEMRAVLAATSDLDSIARRAPVSFAPFRAQAAAL